MDVDGTTDATSRIAQISAQLAALSQGSPAVRRATPATGASGSSVGSSAGGSATRTSFDSVLASALSSAGLSGVAGAGAGAGATSSSSGTAPADDTARDPGLAALAASLVAARPPALSPARTATVTSATVSTATAAVPAPTRIGTSAGATVESATPRTTAPAGAALAAASTTGAAGVAPPARTGTLTAAGTPSDLRAYGNGRLPSALLSPLGVGDHRLWAPAADNFRQMRAAAARDGVQIGVNDSYRSYAEQVDLARRKGLYSSGGLAAAPGTSDHGWGKSVDLQLDGRALSWMRSHAASYGFTADVPRESWHWTYAPR